MKDLVEVSRNEIYCDSQVVARKFGVKHNKVIQGCDRLVARIEKFRGTIVTPKFIKEDREYRGKTYTAYLMNREMFSLLAMRFETKKAFEWQIKFNDAFYSMEKQLLLEIANKQNDAWVLQRSQGKQIRHDTTDVIKDFVNYATTQGSKSAKFYYKHITNATYKALGLLVQRKPKLRDTLDVMELCHIASAEFMVQRSIQKQMASGTNYKEIYNLLKIDLERFASSSMIGEIEPITT